MITNGPKNTNLGILSTVELRLRPVGTNKLEGFQEVVLLSKMRVLFKKRVLFKSGS